MYLIAQDPLYGFSKDIIWMDDITIPWGVALPCFFIFPLFIIITGVLVYSGSNSGKIMFGVFCILFGLANYFAVFIANRGNVEGSIGLELILSGVGTAMTSYGVLLIRSALKKKTDHSYSYK
jgi:hypothetical protein